MPLKKGYSRDVVSSNVRDMVSAGHPVKQAIAAALSMKRKAKKMADGGIVDEDMDSDAGSDLDEGANRSLGELNVLGQSHPNDVENPEYQDHERMLAKALFDKSESEEMNSYAMGGLVEDGPMGDEPVGNKPEEDMMSEAEEPMSSMPVKASSLDHSQIEGVPVKSGLSDEAMLALEAKKKNRRFMR